MKRWNVAQMLDVGRRLFAKIHKQKYHAHHNHELHFMAREINDWLPQGIQSIVDGSYNPRCLKRYYFSDEVVDQLHPSDRILQHILLKQLKPTFKHVMNPNCYHLDGPTGVKYATQRIKQVLRDEKPNYVLRADIKSFYASIPHFQLVQDVKKYYHDPKLHVMLENIITLSKMDVHYLRFQDDILIFAKTKRQLSRCRRRMMDVLHERRLSLSRKKTRMGAICGGFHFLGIDYLPTRTEDNTNMTHINDVAITTDNNVRYLNGNGGGKTDFEHQTCETMRMVPHSRTLRKAREQVKSMVIDGTSSRRIRNYLHRRRCGGQILQQLGNTKTFCNTLLMRAGMSKRPPTRPPWPTVNSLEYYTPARLMSWVCLHKFCKFEVFVRHKFSKARPPRAPTGPPP